ncbi:hypothetical protein KY316_02055 [Candidatus Woesearchaeota archaeon]|nr:hypothetical protein [Candidatus Woesearchaeota archaeon]
MPAKEKKSFGLNSIFTTVLASALLIIIGLIYFIVTLWIVKFGSGLLDLSPDTNWIVLSAAIISAGSMVGSAMQRR